ncbi:hypothetical protein SMB554_33130 (plasmid) [Sinorhizobium meliloti]|nr:hypothetical protein SMB554_33130 [Sinorhizobium meliloti]
MDALSRVSRHRRQGGNTLSAYSCSRVGAGPASCRSPPCEGDARQGRGGVPHRHSRSSTPFRASLTAPRR